MRVDGTGLVIERFKELQVHVPLGVGCDPIEPRVMEIDDAPRLVSGEGGRKIIPLTRRDEYLVLEPDRGF